MGLKAQRIQYLLCKSQESKINYRKMFEVKIKVNKFKGELNLLDLELDLTQSGKMDFGREIST